MGAGQLVRAETATGDVRVILGTSIGPIAIGMSRSAITRVTGPPAATKQYGFYRFRVRGLTVLVSFGHWGRARSLRADSGKLVVNGVPLSAGPSALTAALPQVQRSECGTYTTLFLPQGRRQSGFGFFTAPALPRATIVNTAMRR